MSIQIYTGRRGNKSWINFKSHNLFYRWVKQAAPLGRAFVRWNGRVQCTFQSIVGWFLVNIFFLKSRIVLIYGLWEAHKTVVLYRVPIWFRHMTKHSKNLITEWLGCLGKVWTDELANFHSHHILHFCDAHSHGRPACLWPSNCNSHRRHCWLGFTVGRLLQSRDRLHTCKESLYPVQV